MVILDVIPEITFINSNINIIGWHYINGLDLFNYKNLYYVITKICEIWKITHMEE
jgi:hypothetical protein